MVRASLDAIVTCNELAVVSAFDPITALRRIVCLACVIDFDESTVPFRERAGRQKRQFRAGIVESFARDFFNVESTSGVHATLVL